MDVFQFRERLGSGVDDETEDLACVVIGALIEVHRELGPGLPEKAYREAISLELTLRHIPHECEVPFPIVYKGKVVAEGRMDILVGKKLVLELKVVERLNDVHRAQTVAYLQAMKLKLALLVNFNVAHMKDGIKRVINTY